MKKLKEPIFLSDLSRRIGVSRTLLHYHVFGFKERGGIFSKNNLITVRWEGHNKMVSLNTIKTSENKNPNFSEKNYSEKVR